MTITQLIGQLEETKKKYGDIGVYIPGKEAEETEIRGVAWCEESNGNVASCMICDEETFDAFVD